MGKAGTKRRRMAAEIKSALLKALKTGDAEGVPTLLSANPGMADLPVARGGLSALHLAAMLGDSRMVDALLRCRANPVAKDDFGNTPAHRASTAEAYLLLRDAGAKETDKNRYGQIPGHIVAQPGPSPRGFSFPRIEDAKMRKALGADYALAPNARTRGLARTMDMVGSTPLHLAAREGRLAAALMMLAMGGRLDAADKHGRTPLIEAAAAGADALVGEFLRLGARPCDRDSQGRSALHLACSGGAPGAVMALLSAGADANARDDSGNTPLFYAVSHRDPATAEELSEALLSGGGEITERCRPGMAAVEACALDRAAMPPSRAGGLRLPKRI